mmetsp:Transcript_3184/g.6467  ORF Transcript_3184/g.6467 Transcript_3184/m.6467 type:complete len:135 (+) Transcript_3184:1080-1484(+)
MAAKRGQWCMSSTRLNHHISSGPCSQTCMESSSRGLTQRRQEQQEHQQEQEQRKLVVSSNDWSGGSHRSVSWFSIKMQSMQSVVLDLALYRALYPKHSKPRFTLDDSACRMLSHPPRPALASMARTLSGGEAVV